MYKQAKNVDTLTQQTNTCSKLQVKAVDQCTGCFAECVQS